MEWKWCSDIIFNALIKFYIEISASFWCGAIHKYILTQAEKINYVLVTFRWRMNRLSIPKTKKKGICLYNDISENCKNDILFYRSTWHILC